jgi:hypothetical protein
LVPDQPPAAVHEVALVEDQLTVALWPLVIVLGLAEMATVGAGLLTDTMVDWVALLPKIPVQVSV